jgi:hypothetical protein
MPSVDRDSLALLKEAKTGKRVFFALVAKGGTTGKLLAGKSKVSPTEIGEAKKECGGSAVIQGRCHGENGALVFETVKDTAPAIATLTKKLLKEAGWMVDCEYRTNSDAESDAPTVRDGGGTVPTSPPQGRVPPTTPPGQSTSPQTPPTREDLTLGMAEVLQPRLLTVGRWMKEKKTEMPDIVGKMEKAFLEAGTAFKNHDYSTCEPLLEKLEEVVRRVKQQSSTTQSKTPPTPPPTTTPTTPEVPTTPPPQRARGSSLPPTPPPRQRSVSSPGSIPDSHASSAREKFDNAKQGIEAFKANPNAGLQTPEALEKITAIKSAMLTLVSDEMASEDDVKRKGLVFDSIDANYKKNVTAAVKRTMEAVLPSLTDPTRDPIAAIQILEEGIAALAGPRAHYAETKDVTDKKQLDQRRRKVEAIEAHQNEMRKIAAKFREIIKLKAQPVLDLLKSTKELNDADPGAGGPELKEFGKLLNDENTRKALFQAVDIDQADGLLAMLEAQDSATMDKLSSELAKTRASDSAFMDPFCNAAIQKEASKATDKGTFFRGNSLATKLASTYVTNSPAGKAYCAKVSDSFMARSKGKGPLEVDKLKDQGLSDKDVQKNITAQKKMLGPVIDDLTSDPNAIPPEMAKIAAIFYDEAKRVTGGDEDFATTQAGGFIMLRVVNPALTRTAAEKTNAQKKDSAREKAANDQRLAILQTKLLQNMSNGATFDKEAFMKPFDDQIVDTSGEYAPQTAKLRGFLKGIAENAPRG